MSNIAQLFPTETAEPESQFDEFWSAYPAPRRQGKAVAKSKFDAITGPGLTTRTLDKDSGGYVELILQDTPENVIRGAKAYADSQKNTGSGAFGYRDGGKYVMQPARFLNSGAWMDWL